MKNAFFMAHSTEGSGGFEILHYFDFENFKTSVLASRLPNFKFKFKLQLNTTIAEVTRPNVPPIPSRQYRLCHYTAYVVD